SDICPAQYVMMRAPITAWRCRLAEALFFPGIAVHVITAFFPIACSIAGQKLDGSYPLRAFPRIQTRHNQSQRAAVFSGDWLAIMRIRKKRVFGGKLGEGHVCSPAFIVGMDQHITG